MGKFVVKIDQQNCKGCQLCIANCPKGVLGLSEEVNRLGYKYCVVLKPENCIGCGNCYLMCPDYVIEIYKKR